MRAGLQSHAYARVSSTMDALDRIDHDLFRPDGTIKHRLLFSLNKIKFDEAGARFAMNVCPEILCGATQTATWPMMVARRELLWQCADAPLQRLTIAVPPVLMLGKLTAETCYCALFLMAVPKRVRVCQSVGSHMLVCVCIMSTIHCTMGSLSADALPL